MTPLARRLALRAAERPMPFSDFMAAALYDPEDGYYAKGPAIGAEGDFFTAPNLPGFAAALARGLRDLWERLGKPQTFTVVELGAGTGDLAVALKRELADLPLRYVCVEPSEGLAARQRARGLESVPDLARVGRGEATVVVANEVLDALPVHRVLVAPDGTLQELYVRYRPGHGFGEVAGELSTPALADWLAGAELPPGRIVEACLLYGPLLRALASAVAEGYVVLVDYGDERPRIHADERAGGTLRAFHEHALSDDVFANVGDQDLTASVDFTRVKAEAEAAGFDVAGYATQGEVLLSLGILDDHARLAAEDPFAALQAKTLFTPGGMGDAFKVLVLAKNAPTDGLRAFAPPVAGAGYWL